MGIGKTLAIIGIVFIFMVLMDIFTFAKVGYLFFPNWSFMVTLLLDAPLACIMSIELSVIVSSRMNDVRSAQQLAGVVLVPFLLLYILTEFGVITIDVNTMLLIAGILALIDIVLFFASRALFRREEILTKWK